MLHATAYLRGSKVIVHPLSETMDGVLILDSPVTISDFSNSLELGKNVVDALNASKTHVDHPSMWKGLFDPVLNLAGVKSQSAFMKSNRCVFIKSNGSEIEMIPTKNMGVKGGFEHLIELALKTNSKDNFEIGYQLTATFSYSS